MSRVLSKRLGSANRGEIARRIFSTARHMGLTGVAVYADADVEAPFVTDADVAVHLPTGYLDGDAIVEAAPEDRRGRRAPRLRNSWPRTPRSLDRSSMPG